jgi:hypothetical protein
MKPKTKAASSRRRSPVGLSAKRSLLFSFRGSSRAFPTLSLRSSRRRNGKVARLAHQPRGHINSLIRDGLPYAHIIAQLGDAGKTLTYHNLVRWRKAGYRE